MYKHLNILSSVILSLSISASTPQQKKKVILNRSTIQQSVCNDTVATVHEVLANATDTFAITLNTQAYHNMAPFILFACLPKDLRIHTLINNFFNSSQDPDNYAAAKQFESKPYVESLCLLTEYLKKPYPYTLLSPEHIFLLCPQQIQVVAEIEKQELASLNQVRGPVPVHPWYIIPRSNTNANLTYAQLQILQTIPDEIIAQSPLNGKVIGSPHSFKTFFKALKDSVIFCINNQDAQSEISILTVFIALVNSCGTLFRVPKELTPTWNCTLRWFGPHLFVRMFMPWVIDPKANIMLSTLIDGLYIGAATYYGKRDMASVLFNSSIFIPLLGVIYGIIPLIGVVNFMPSVRYQNKNPHRHTITAAKKRVQKETSWPCILL